MAEIEVAGKSELLLVESTTLDPLPCVVLGKVFDGVQAHHLDEVVKAYKGRVWEYPLDRPLYEFESERLISFSLKVHRNALRQVGGVSIGRHRPFVGGVAAPPRGLARNLLF